MKLWDRSQKLIFALKGLPINYKPASIIGFDDCICSSTVTQCTVNQL